MKKVIVIVVIVAVIILLGVGAFLYRRKVKRGETPVLDAAKAVHDNALPVLEQIKPVTEKASSIIKDVTPNVDLGVNIAPNLKAEIPLIKEVNNTGTSAPSSAPTSSPAPAPALSSTSANMVDAETRAIMDAVNKAFISSFGVSAKPENLLYEANLIRTQYKQYGADWVTQNMINNIKRDYTVYTNYLTTQYKYVPDPKYLTQGMTRDGHIVQWSNEDAPLGKQIYVNGGRNGEANKFDIVDGYARAVNTTGMYLLGSNAQWIDAWYVPNSEAQAVVEDIWGNRIVLSKYPAPNDTSNFQVYVNNKRNGHLKKMWGLPNGLAAGITSTNRYWEFESTGWREKQQPPEVVAAVNTSLKSQLLGSSVTF